MPDTPAPAPTTHTLSEAASKALLRRARRAGARRADVADAADAAAAAAELGYPVVREAVRRRASRTRPSAGLVRLGLGDADAGARRRPPSCSPRPRPTTATVALLVAPMVRGNRELIAGLVARPAVRADA